MRLVFATQNNNKAREIQKLVNDSFEIITLNDLGVTEEIPETGETLEENARIKARFVFERFGYSCFADDTGLEVESLNGEPGVYSARYAGEAKSDEANMNKLLTKLAPHENRRARFVTYITLILNDTEHIFEGVLEGKIRKEKTGTNGFGYDPLFMPDGYDVTLAEMSMEQKNKISHRARAFRKMAEFLEEHLPNA